MPLVRQMCPSADVHAEISTEVGISTIEPGKAIKAVFRRQPLFVKRLTAAEIAAANAVDVATLRDPQTLDERTKPGRSEEHTSELQSLMRISYAVFCLKKKKINYTKK